MNGGTENAARAAMPEKLRRAGALIAVLLLAMVPVACGGSDDGAGDGDRSGETTAAAEGDGPANLAELIEMHPSSIVKRFLTASLEGDGETACQLLTPAARKRVERQGGGPESGESCEQVVTATAEDLDGEPVIQVAGRAVTASEVNSLDLLATITEFGKQPIARVLIEDMKRPVILHQFDQDWLIETVPPDLQVQAAA